MTLDELLALKKHLPRPLKVVHCGSTDKAREAFEYWRLQDTLDSMIVMTVGARISDAELNLSAEKKVELDLLHLAKIEEADLVRILNVGGYIGESTRRELEYAQRLGKPVLFLEDPAGVCLTMSIEHNPCPSAILSTASVVGKTG